MTLLKLYKQRNQDTVWFDTHASLGQGASGRMFEYTTTNYRTQAAFIKNFQTFSEIENMPRDQWPRQESHGQEKHKQHVVNMLQSKLFKRDVSDFYNRTKKGELYADFISQEFTLDE